MSLRAVVVFGSASVALHLAALGQLTLDGAASGGGDAGASVVTLTAASPEVAALVETWTTAPAVTGAPPPRTAAPRSEAAPAQPRPLADTAPRRQTGTDLPIPRAARPAPERQAAAPTVPSQPRVAATTPGPAPNPTGPAPASQAAPTVPPAIMATAAPAVPAAPTPAPAAAPAPATAPAPPTTAPRPRPRPEVSSGPDQAPQRAAGNGTVAAKGAADTRRASAASAGATARLQAEWSASIGARIARFQRYPRGDHGEGRVKVQITIQRSGALGGVTLAVSSGRRALDTAALQAVRRAAPFPPAPNGLEGKSFVFSQAMRFERR